MTESVTTKNKYEVELVITYIAKVPIWASDADEAKNVVELKKQTYIVGLGEKPSAKIIGIRRVS